jgi:hypothetical protein
MKIGYDMCYRFGTPPRPAEPLRQLALALGVQPELPQAIQALPLTSIAVLRSQHGYSADWPSPSGSSLNCHRPFRLFRSRVSLS